MSEIKPCPFCGSTADVAHDIQRPVYYVDCKRHDCCVGPDGDTREAAIAAWNRRDGGSDGG